MAGRGIVWLPIALTTILAVGCFGEPEHYWTSGCVTPDGTLLGVQGDEAALIDLETGGLVRRVDGYYEDVVCFPNGEVLALRKVGPLTKPGEFDDSVWLTSGKEVVGGVEGPDFLEAISDTSFVTASRSYEMRDDDDIGPAEWNGPLYVRVHDAGGRTLAARRGLQLDPELFPGFDGARVEDFHTSPIGVLDDGRLVVSVGYVWTRYDEERWGLFAVDLESGAVSPFESFGFDEAPPRFGLSDASFSADGGSLVFASVEDDAREILVRREGVGEDVLAVPLEAALESFELRLNSDGTLLAVAKLPEGERVAKVEVFDVESGQILWEMRAPGTPYLAEFLSDDSLVVMTSERVVVRRDSADGRVLWEHDPETEGGE